MKFTVTPELASLLKTLRARNGVSSKDVAQYLGKSPSYLSKLEGGMVQAIQQDTLKDMLIFIAGGADFYEMVLPDVANLLLASIEEHRLIDQVWFLQFDVGERPVQVPVDMAQDIELNLSSMHINAGQLAQFINANIDSEMTSAFPANQLIAVDYDGQHRLLARPEFSELDVDQVIHGKETQTSYFILYSIVHSMFRLQRYGSVETKLPPAEAINVLESASDYMQRWNIHSLVGFSRLLASDEFIQHQLPLATNRSGIVERIAAQLCQIVDRDSIHAIGELNVFYSTLEWDPAFALKILGLPFADLGSMSFSNKRKLIADIQKLIEHYDQMDEFDRKIENY